MEGGDDKKAIGSHLRAYGFFGGATRNRTGDEGFADLCLTAWLWRLIQFGVGKGSSSFRMIKPVWARFFEGKRARIYRARMERITGLEPATSTLARWRSTK